MKSLPVLLLVVLASTALSGPRRTQVRSAGTEYIDALAVANQFLDAWRARHQPEGLALCSPALRKRKTDAELRMFISGLSNPHHAAFEVSDGKQIKPGRFTFQVRLYETYTGMPGSGVKPKATQIAVVKLGDGTWKVDSLP